MCRRRLFRLLELAVPPMIVASLCVLVLPAILYSSSGTKSDVAVLVLIGKLENPVLQGLSTAFLSSVMLFLAIGLARANRKARLNSIEATGQVEKRSRNDDRQAGADVTQRHERGNVGKSG